MDHEGRRDEKSFVQNSIVRAAEDAHRRIPNDLPCWSVSS